MGSKQNKTRKLGPRACLKLRKKNLMNALKKRWNSVGAKSAKIEPPNKYNNGVTRTEEATVEHQQDYATLNNSVVPVTILDIKFENEDVCAYETKTDIENNSQLLDFHTLESQPEVPKPDSEVSDAGKDADADVMSMKTPARCSNCALDLPSSATDSYSEFQFMTVSANKQTVVTVSDALRTVLEPWLKLEEEKILPEAEIPMCNKCLSILAGLFKFYTSFLVLTKVDSYIYKLTSKSAVWKSKPDMQASDADPKLNSFSTLNNSKMTETRVPPTLTTSDHEVVENLEVKEEPTLTDYSGERTLNDQDNMDFVEIMEVSIDTNEEILGLDRNYDGFDFDACSKSEAQNHTKTEPGRIGGSVDSPFELEDFQMTLTDTYTNGMELIGYSFSCVPLPSGSGSSKRVKLKQNDNDLNCRTNTSRHTESVVIEGQTANNGSPLPKMPFYRNTCDSGQGMADHQYHQLMKGPSSFAPVLSRANTNLEGTNELRKSSKPSLKRAGS